MGTMYEISEAEQLREALVDLERAREQERGLRLESEALLAGLRVLTLSESREALFAGLLEVFRTVLAFGDAFVLTMRDDGTMRPVAATAAAFADSVWRPQALFQRVIAGQPTAVFDVGQIAEWQDQPEPTRAAVRSALHIPLRGGAQAAVLICTHPERGYFGPKHTRLVRRFVPLASQALRNVDLQQTIAERNRLFTLSLDLMGIIGYDGYLKQLNPAWEQTLGFAPEALQARPFIELVHPEDRAATTAAIQQLTAGAAAVSFENRCLCQDNSYKWLLWNATAYVEERLIYVVARDVTARRQAEEALRKAVAELEQRTQEVETTHRLYLRREWQDFLSQREPLRRSGLLYDQTQVAAVPGLWRPEMARALVEKRLVAAADHGETPAGGSADAGTKRTGLAMPIIVRGQPIGVLGLEDPDGTRQWSEHDQTVLQAIGQQLGLALENARLLEETQRRAARERLTGEITARMRETLDVDTVVQTAVREMRQALGIAEAEVRLDTGETLRREA